MHSMYIQLIFLTIRTLVLHSFYIIALFCLLYTLICNSFSGLSFIFFDLFHYTIYYTIFVENDDF